MRRLGSRCFSCFAGLMLCALTVDAWAGEEGQGQGLKVDKLWLEAGALTDRSDANGNGFVHVAISTGGELGKWEYGLGLRADGMRQFGERSMERVRLDYTENFLRWRSDDLGLTVGTQKVLWGRVDEISPIDRMSRVDLTRVVMDKLPDRRRAVPAVRLESFGEGSKLDAVWLPVFDDAVMPGLRSVWSPVDTIDGRLLGFGSVPLIVGARVKRSHPDSGGGGLRYTVEGDALDYGFSLQRVRQSQPYYRFKPGLLEAVHPFSTVVGAELEAERLGATWRMEATWSSAVPVTSPTLQLRTERAVDVVLGTEFFPGDSETRVTLQLAGHKTLGDGPTLDRTEIYALVGEVEHPFALGRWRADLRFSVGLDERDLYLNPKLTYAGFDRHELYLAAHVFSGSAQTLGGYYRHNDIVVIGWQARF